MGFEAAISTQLASQLRHNTMKTETGCMPTTLTPPRVA